MTQSYDCAIYYDTAVPADWSATHRYYPRILVFETPYTTGDCPIITADLDYYSNGVYSDSGDYYAVQYSDAQDEFINIDSNEPMIAGQDYHVVLLESSIPLPPL